MLSLMSAAPNGGGRGDFQKAVQLFKGLLYLQSLAIISPTVGELER